MVVRGAASEARSWSYGYEQDGRDRGFDRSERRWQNRRSLEESGHVRAHSEDQGRGHGTDLYRSECFQRGERLSGGRVQRDRGSGCKLT